MKQLNLQAIDINSKFLYLSAEGPKGPEDAERSTPSQDKTVITPDWIKQRNSDIQTKIDGIPVPPAVQNLAHGQIGDLINQTAGKEVLNRSQLEKSIEDTLNDAEGEQVDTARAAKDSDVTQETIEAQRQEIETQLRSYLEQVAKTYAEEAAKVREETNGDPEGEKMANSIDGKSRIIKQLGQQIGSNGIDWENSDFSGLGGDNEAVVQAAQAELGQANSDAEGNAKYTPGGADQPWCRDFVNYVCKQAGHDIGDASLAQECIGGSGLGHICIKVGGQCLGGNQGNKVCYKSMPSTFEWNTAEAAANGDKTPKQGEAPDGSLIVTKREASDSSVT